MKIVQTFWNGPGNNKPKNAFAFTAGWPSPEYHWMSWALSCLQAKKFFGEVDLITDEQGKYILSDVLRLPYSNVSTALEKRLDKYPSQLWSIAKLFSYSIQEKPFIHLDGDVFLWMMPEEKILQAEVVAQNLEENLFFYKKSLDVINENLTFLPSYLSKNNYTNKDIYASNAGIFGGNNISFIKKYCAASFEFIDKNLSELHKINIPDLNFICEQYVLHQISLLEKVPITYYIEEIVSDPVYKQFIKFEDVPFVKMIHTVGGFKKFIRVCNHISKKLRREYPDVYYRIIDIMQYKGVEMMSKIYDEMPAGFKNINANNHKIKVETSSHDEFKRTIAAVEYFNQNNLFKLNIDKENFNDKSFISLLEKTLPGSVEKDILNEIYNIELSKNKFYEDLYSDRKNLIKIYEDDVHQYNLIQEIFLLDVDAILKTTLCMHSTVVEIETGWNWRYYADEQIPLLIKTNFETQKQQQFLLLLPLILQKNINEYYLDTLDMIIAESARDAKTISTLAEDVKQYFEDDLSKNNDFFIQLLFDSVKRLLYAGVLKIIS